MDNTPLLPRPIKTMDDLVDVVSEVLELADKGVVRLMCYTIVGNALRLGPIWVTLIAPPSGGKSELLQSLFDLKDVVYPLSSLTPNTFLSGMMATDRQTSLLDIVNGKTIITKDFTTIVEMNKEEQRSILGQMREIYDKRFTKAFGTGMNKDWSGHVGWLGAITSEGAEQLQSRGSMGERFIYYRMKQPDRKKVMRRAAQNQANNMEVQQLKLRNAFYDYLMPRVIAAREISDSERTVIVPEDLTNRIESLCDFATEARSNVNVHWKTGHILFVHPKEMPIRFTNQNMAIAAAALFCHKNDYPEGDPRRESVTLDKEDMVLFGNIAWGSIPPHRAVVIKLLAEFKSSSTKAIAAKLGYDTDVARPWLAELAGLDIIKRDAVSHGTDNWSMHERYRKLVCSYTGAKMRDEGISDAEAGVEDEYEVDELGNIMNEVRQATPEEIAEAELESDRLFDADNDNY